jgi:hypothetical protein
VLVALPFSILVWHYVIDAKDRDHIINLLGQRV